jgi:hypothetical protein
MGGVLVPSSPSSKGEGDAGEEDTADSLWKVEVVVAGWSRYSVREAGSSEADVVAVVDAVGAVGVGGDGDCILL